MTGFELCIMLLITIGVIGLFFGIVILLVTKIMKEHLESQSSYYQNFMKEIMNLKKEDPITYSEKFTKYLDTIIANECALEFKEFLDGHHVEMITKINVQKVVENISRRINDMINHDMVEYDRLLLQRSYYESYIVHVTISNVKRILERVVDEN